MKLSDIKKERERYRDMTPDQLNDELAKLKREAFNLRFQRATGQLENTSRVSEVRRSLARLKTLVAERRKQSQAKA